MAMVINTNISAINAQRNLGKTQASLQTTMQRLSSGLRINSAKDDAAGIGIASRMTSQVRGLTQAARNANNAISVVQTIEGGLDEIHNMLQRMRELAVQASDDSNTATDRTSLNAEFQALKAEINRIAGSTKYNDQNVLDNSPSNTNRDFQIGSDNHANNRITVIAIDARVITLSAYLDGANLTNKANAQDAIDYTQTAINQVLAHKSNLGAVNNRLDYTVANLNNIIENVTAARSRVMDADFAVETANMTRASILQQAGVSVLAQANQQPQAVLALLQR
jgi:flagellin